MGMVIPGFLWDNFLRRCVVSASFSPAFGNDPASLTDWRDFSIFELPPGEWVEFAIASTQDVGDLIAWVEPGPFTIDFQCGAWSIGYLTPITDPSPFAVTTVPPQFAGGTTLRLTNTGPAPVRFRQLTAGTWLRPDTGQNADLVLPKFPGGLVTENVIAMNGSMLARNVRRVEKSCQVSLQYLSHGWLQQYWKPFMEHATRFPFYYRWNFSPLGTSTDQIVFAAAEQINQPKNMMPPPLCSVDLPLRIIE